MVRNAVVFICLIFIFFTFARFKAEANFNCLTLKTTSNQSDKDYCQNELTQIEAELTRLLDLQKQQQKQTGTLAGDVNYLTSQINALKTKIKARALVIAQLKVNITEKVNVINSLSSKIEREHESLAQLLRNTNEFDEETLVQLILSDVSVSNFYSDLESYTSIKQAVKDSVDIIRGVKTQTEVAKQDLEKKQNAETDAKVELESAQKKVVQSETEKKQLLAISKNTEAAYQKLANEKKARADRIRSALFPLRDSKAIPFGTALQYAKSAEKFTGISPAFLLAIITQESNLGTDSGSCYLTNFETGEGISSKSGKFFKNVMKPMGLSGRKGDVDDFISITKSVGRDPTKTLVSCPIGGYGYGGAMGPAQFIPTTWTGIANKVAIIFNISNLDPWEPKDAFMASAVFLSELGASGNSYSAQIKAACKYYGTGGATCAYGRSVMGKISGIQDKIDIVSEN